LVALGAGFVIVDFVVFVMVCLGMGDFIAIGAAIAGTAEITNALATSAIRIRFMRNSNVN
jgi:hypothetical protein